jgi:hypothetical protein
MAFKFVHHKKTEISDFSVANAFCASVYVVCADIDNKIDGGWSEWSDFTCSVPCGAGFGFRTRACTNPRPSFQGYPCIGSSTEDGVCNQFDCGCLNPSTKHVPHKRQKISKVTNYFFDSGNIINRDIWINTMTFVIFGWNTIMTSLDFYDNFLKSPSSELFRPVDTLLGYSLFLWART